MKIAVATDNGRDSALVIVAKSGSGDQIWSNLKEPANVLFRANKLHAKLRKDGRERQAIAQLLPYGVIGNTSDFGSDILGSSPSRVA